MTTDKITWGQPVYNKPVIDIEYLKSFLTEACEHYAKTAPVVSNFIDTVYIDIQDNPQAINLITLYTIGKLYEYEIKTFIPANYAQNLIYKYLESINNAVGILDH